MRDRFKCGLECLGVLEAVRQHSETMQQAFVYCEQCLDATMVDELFHIVWSERDSNRFTKEQEVVTYWRDFLMDAECMRTISVFQSHSQICQ